MGQQGQKEARHYQGQHKNIGRARGYLAMLFSVRNGEGVKRSLLKCTRLLRNNLIVQ